MITPRKPECSIKTDLFDYARRVVWDSGVAELIEDRYRASSSAGGRKLKGIEYTATAVLAALLIRILMQRPPTLVGVLRTIGEFSPDQLTDVGMAGQDCATVWDAQKREYARFAAWWSRRMAPFDSWIDLPARRITNREYRALIARRTDAQRQHSVQAARLLHVAINRLVAASVEDPNPQDCRGDLVVDGTLYAVAKLDGRIGMADDKLRGAVACSNLHVRDNKSKSADGARATRLITHAAMSVEMTALTRIGKPAAMHAVAPVFVGIAVHYATSGSPQGMADALEQAEANGLTGRPRGLRTRWPNMTFDMAYNSKEGCAETLLRHRYNPVGRYPSNWSIERPSTKFAGSPDSDPEPGPLQWAGAFFCPAVLAVITGHRTPQMRNLLENNGFRRHDDRLRRILPYLMGYNSRPFLASAGRGRPALGRIPNPVVKVKLVCPAAMGTLRCPLKPESMTQTAPGTPTAEPTWQAHERGCCVNSSVVVTLTPDQFKRAQWDLVPGAWDHTFYFEAARALTEQRFNHLKSAHISGLNQLNFGPRREPMIKLILAMAVVASNRTSQLTHDPSALRPESIDVKQRQLADRLGHEPAQTPPRT